MSDQPSTHASIDPVGTDSLPRLVQIWIDQLAATQAIWERIEQQGLPLLERIASALERGKDSGVQPVVEVTDLNFPVPPVSLSYDADFRVAINEGRWDRAEAIVALLAQQEQNQASAQILADELGQARERAVKTLRARIEAARGANDPTGAIEARDQLAAVLPIDEMHAVDRSLIDWLMKSIQRRLRSIPISPDLAILVALVADRFGGTPEGASLRAALPTLRRSAGLCPRCAEPYLGVDDACLNCLMKAGQEPSPTPTLSFVPAPDDLDAVIENSAPIDLNDIASWQNP